jgi:hypothetical protein
LAKRHRDEPRPFFRPDSHQHCSFAIDLSVARRFPYVSGGRRHFTSDIENHVADL